MAQRVKCDICDREFKDAHGLEQHKAAMHKQHSEHSSHIVKSGISAGKIIGIIAILAIIALPVWALISAMGSVNSCKTAPITDISIEGHNNLALHIHQDLVIIIDGKRQVIPANIGVTDDYMRPIHTHDATGHLHVEGPCPRDFKLGEFFQVWGKDFNSERIFEYTTSSGVFTMTVDGIQNNEFENLILRDGQQIVIEYISN